MKLIKKDDLKNAQQNIIRTILRTKLTVHIPSQDNFPLWAVLAATIECGPQSVQCGHIIIYIQIYIHVPCTFIQMYIQSLDYKLSYTWAASANA